MKRKQMPKKRFDIKTSDFFGIQLLAYINQVKKDSSLLDSFDSSVLMLCGSLKEIRGQLKQLKNQQKKILVVVYYSPFIYVGPYWSCTERACPNCLIIAIDRHFNKDEPSLEEIENSIRPEQPYIFPPNVFPNVIQLISFVLSKKNTEENHVKQIFLLNTITSKISTEYLLPELQCGYCNEKTQTTRPFLNFSNGINSSDHPTRERSLDEISKYLENICAGNQVGIIKNITYDFQMPFAGSTAYLALNKGKREPTLGRSQYFERSATIATLEALERLSGFRGNYNVLTCLSSYKDLLEEAINPREFGLHSNTQYKIKDFPFVCFDESLPLKWVKGLNLNTNKELWVPQSMAFYGQKLNALDNHIVYETSNGCSIGTSIEEAILHGLLELIERDSFLVTWYKNLGLFEITEKILRDNQINSLYKKATLFTGAKIKFFDSTMEHGIASVFAIAEGNKKNSPSTAASAGAGLTFYHAAETALYELIGHYLRLEYILNQKNARKKALSMFLNSHEVREMEDHGLVNSIPEARSRFDFLVHKDNRVKTPAVYFNFNQLKSPSDCLSKLIQQFTATGFQIIVVDQTTPTLKELNLNCVKVLVPHFVPMAFGFQFSRLEVQRLKNNEGLTPTLEKTFPHPFP